MPGAPKLGTTLKKQRKAKNLTLQELAEQSGVSRSMLSEIERDKANPTFAVLWSLTTALDIEISDLLNAADTGGLGGTVDIVSKSDTPEISNAGGSYRLRILNPPDSAGRIEWYHLEIEPGASLESDAHAAGTIEHFTATSGRFAVTSGSTRRELEISETARYSVDVAHRITNLSDHAATGFLVVQYGKK